MQRRTFLAAMGALAGVPGQALSTALAEDKEGKNDTAPANKRYRVIDTHLHLFNSRRMGSDGVPVLKYLSVDATIEGYVAAMKQGNVDKAFLITYNAEDVAPQLRSYGIDPAAVRLVYNTTYQRTALKQHPELFWWFPEHIDPVRETYLEDLEKNFEQGAAGIKMMTVFHGYFPDHPSFMPVYEMCRKYKKPIIMDLSYWYLNTMPAVNELPERRNRVHRFSDYAELLTPIFKQFSDVPISLAHTGTALRVSDYDEILPFIAQFPNLSCDIAAATGYSPDWLQKLVKAVGAGKIMYGTDWPYWATGVNSYLKGERRWTMIADECPALNEEQKRAILAGNAERFVAYQMPAAIDGEGKESKRGS